MNTKNKKVLVNVGNVDWSLLAEQKEALLSTIADSNPQVSDQLEGLLHMVDDIQDQAAEELGENVVFPHLIQE